jgi:hypothetical protein
VTTKIKTDKVAETITPLAQRVARDPELREHAKNIAESAKKIYDRVQSEGTKRAASNKSVQDEVVRAASELRIGATKLVAKPKVSKKRKAAKVAVAGAAVVGGAVVAKKALSKDEDEFEYTP